MNVDEIFALGRRLEFFRGVRGQHEHVGIAEDPVPSHGTDRQTDRQLETARKVDDRGTAYMKLNQTGMIVLMVNLRIGRSSKYVISIYVGEFNRILRPI